MARYFKKFSRHESSWCFWILNVWSKQFLGGTLLPFRCFPSVIFLWSQVGSWMKDVANSGWCQTQGLITSQKGMSMRLCRDALGVNHWLKTPSYMSWSPILRFASTCTISGLRDFADLAILQVWLHWCHSVLHVFCSVRQGNETRIAVLNVQRRCSNLLAFTCNTSQRSCFLPKLWPRNTHLTSARCDVCQVEGCHRNPDLQSKRGGLAVMLCSSESIWKMRKSPKRHGKMRKHVNEPRSDVSLMGSEIGHWVWFEKCQRRGWVFVSSCLTTILEPRRRAETEMVIWYRGKSHLVR